MKKKTRSMIPIKTTGGVLTALFLLFFGVFEVKAQTIATENFNLSFDCPGFFQGTQGTLLSFVSTGDGPNYIDFMYLESGGDPSYFLDATYEDGNLSTFNRIIDGNNYVDFSNPKKISFEYCNGVASFFWGDLKLDQDIKAIELLTDMQVDTQTACVENLVVNAGCIASEETATTTENCYIPDNEDIGVITGVVEKQENGATTTEFYTFKIPFILYIFIFTIVITILSIIIAWLFSRK